MNINTCIILAAGKGTRMNDERTHKVCYEIAGVPAIIRLIDNLRQAGITRYIVVVGNKADKVMMCLKDVEGVVFAYQSEQKGTGSAALCGLKVMQAMELNTVSIKDSHEPVLIVMGDKIISPDAINSLKSAFDPSTDKKPGAAFIVQPKGYNKSGGRVVMRNGRIYGIVEQMEICLTSIGTSGARSDDEIKAVIDRMGLNEKKGAMLYSKAIAKAGETGGPLPETYSLCGEAFTPDELENSGLVNTATYIFDSSLAYDALIDLSSDNTQNEIYLTDAINKLAKTHRIETVRIDEPSKILTYSTMDDLLRLEQYFKSQGELAKGYKGSIGTSELPPLRKAGQWLEIFDAFDETTKDKLKEIYGDNEELITERRRAYQGILREFIQKYGDRGVIMARAPGRVNLMGRHIEHRGGSINVMSVSKEMLLVASPRQDDIVRINNVDGGFKEHEFSILQSTSQYDTTNWVEFIESDAILKMVTDNKGDWVNYVKAGVLRLQLSDKSRILCGMDMMFNGNIPIAAGLSSSSSIVVATMEAATAINNTQLQVKDFINLCGEGEWFVGSRGGAGDHAAMKCGKKGQITHIDFFPIHVGGAAAFPNEYDLIVANSFVEAKKSAGAKDQFNQCVASYEFGFMLLKQMFPQYRDKLKHLRDVTPDALKVFPSKIYEMLLALPESITIDELKKRLPEGYHKPIDRILRTHKNLDSYQIRSVVLYGIAEIERAKKFYHMLKENDYKGIGKLMNISHDGDRIYKDGKPYRCLANDVALYKLIGDLRSEEPSLVDGAQLYNQPGGYACSTETIDAMVDHINEIEGVLGCQLSGAGLGGCIMILVKKEATKKLLTELKEWYYDKNELPMGAEVFIPVAGSMVL